MRELQELIKEKLVSIEKQLNSMKLFMKKEPKGTLKIKRTEKRTQFYWRKDIRDANGTYIKRKDNEIAKILAQKSYIKKILPIVETYTHKLKELEGYDFMAINEIYDNMSLERKQLVEPYILSDNEFVDKWIDDVIKEKEKITGKNDFEDENSKDEDEYIYTEKGEVVRSKSEKIIADK